MLLWTRLEQWTPWAIVAFAPPLVALAIITGVMLLVGLMGADYPDAAREWTAEPSRSAGLLNLRDGRRTAL